jgi:hypothetical protein
MLIRSPKKKCNITIETCSIEQTRQKVAVPKTKKHTICKNDMFMGYLVQTGWKLRATACKNRESQVKWKYLNFFLFHQINPISVPTMEKNTKKLLRFFFRKIFTKSWFCVGNELIFMLELVDI